MSADEPIALYEKMIADYPLLSIEDGLDEEDWANWQALNGRIGQDVQLVGDDLLVTNTERLSVLSTSGRRTPSHQANQIGSLSETIQAVKMAKSAGWRTVMSHRSGETEDTTIAHLAVGLRHGANQNRSLSRSERIAKYNEIMRIAEANPGAGWRDRLGCVMSGKLILIRHGESEWNAPANGPAGPMSVSRTKVRVCHASLARSWVDVHIDVAYN